MPIDKINEQLIVIKSIDRQLSDKLLDPSSDSREIMTLLDTQLIKWSAVRDLLIEIAGVSHPLIEKYDSCIFERYLLITYFGLDIRST